MPDLKSWIAEAKARCAVARPGPWRWNLNMTSKSVSLESCAPGGMLEYVMDFVRWGMSRAKPRFFVDGLMEDADGLAKPLEGRRHHVTWFQTIAHPDAEFIAHARTDLPRALSLLEKALDIAEELRNFCTTENADGSLCFCVNDDGPDAPHTEYCKRASAALRDFDEAGKEKG